MEDKKSDNTKINNNKETREYKEEISDTKEITVEDKEIDELRKQLNEETNKNKILEDKIKDLNNTINKLKQDKNDIIKKCENEKLISVLFMTKGTYDIFNYSMACRPTDLFANLEARLYKDFPQYRNIKKYFMVNNNRISESKTLEKNKIKNNDIISIFTIE